VKVLYHCYGGTHSSILAAAIHAGYCDPDRPPARRELDTLPLFDKRAGSDYGKARFYGRDERGHEIWVVGRLRYLSAPGEVFAAMAGLFPDSARTVVVDVAPTLNWQMRFGGFISRALRLPAFGRPLIARGTRLAYSRIRALVTRTKEELEAIEDHFR